MSYYQMLNFSREPFSNTPDPEFFFETRQHLQCLQKIELSVRLRRGLVVVIGEVGTGKTTLCRQLIRRFHRSDEIETYLVLDPEVNTPIEFLRYVAVMLTGQQPPDDADIWQLKEIIKNTLFRKGVDEGRGVVLIVDEGQKAPPFCLELLREFLNYETNEAKLLQIVIFAQKELEATLEKHQNFTDRISLYHVLEPLDFKDTRQLITHRLRRCSTQSGAADIFTYGAMRAIHRITRGYPRKIINLCHLCLMTLIINNRSRVTGALVRASAKRLPYHQEAPVWRRAPALAAALVLLAAVVVIGYGPVIQALKPAMVGKTVATGVAAEAVQPGGQAFDSTVATRVDDAASAAQDGLQTVNERPEIIPNAWAHAGPSDPAPGEKATPEKGRAEPPQGGLYSAEIKAGESLYWMTKKMYGDTSPRIMSIVSQANSHLPDLNRISVGETIRFPLVPTAVDGDVKEYYYVEILNTHTLEKAFERVRELRLVRPEARIIPYWTPREEVRFAVVIPPVCKEKQQARKMLDGLPDSLARKAELASFSGGDYFYFADLFTVK